MDRITVDILLLLLCNTYPQLLGNVHDCVNRHAYTYHKELALLLDRRNSATAAEGSGCAYIEGYCSSLTSKLFLLGVR